MEILGIDIGGSGIKGAPVDLEKGRLKCERHRIATPDSARPEAVAKVVARIARHFDHRGPIGCTLPSVIIQGRSLTAANIDEAWIGLDARALLEEATGVPVVLLNDADAAGLAEMRHGAGRGEDGVVMILTFGTGIGSAAFCRGRLWPNTELGHLEVDGKDAEKRAAASVKEEKGLSWHKWTKRVDRYLDVLDQLFWPDLFIFGGGISKKHAEFIPLLSTRARVVPAQLFNDAGIVGAALHAADVLKDRR